MSGTLLGIDAGTTGVTVILYDLDLRPLHRGYAEFAQHYPQAGWVEHDAVEIRDVTLRLVREVGGSATDPVRAVGITNQRETIVPLDVATGEPLARAIVWQCRRTTEMCAALKGQGLEARYRAATGLLLDPYFSGTKMRWLLENAEAVAACAAGGNLRFATIDAFLIHALTGGDVLATDPTNASRTLVFDIDAQDWSDALMGPLSIERSMLPEVRSSAGSFGTMRREVVGFEAPIAGVAGDQQAALFGQGCFDIGTAKNTYGTGCFFLMNAGETRPGAPDGLLTTIAADASGRPIYAVEGSVFVAGAAVQWLRDELGIIGDARETAALAASIDDNGGVYLVPAFAGLGAPWWDPGARGVLCGLTRGTGRAHLARAALESIAFQSADLFRAIDAAVPGDATSLRVDGGACANDWLMQFQADLLGVPVTRGADLETTSRGAALLAAVGEGVVDDPRKVAALAEDRAVFEPRMSAAERERLFDEWHRAVARARLSRRRQLMKVHVVLLIAVAVSFMLPVVELQGDLKWIQTHIAPFVDRVSDLEPIVSEPDGSYSFDLGLSPDLSLDLRRSRWERPLERALADGVLVGHECAELQGRFLLKAARTDLDRDQLRGLGEVLWTALAMPLFLASFVLAVRKRWWLSFAMAGCAVGSASWWIYAVRVTTHLEYGYWIWVAALTATAFRSMVIAIRRDAMGLVDDG